LELEGSYQTKLDLGDFPNCPPDAICAAVRGGTFSLHGRIASLSGNVVAQLPVHAAWVRPYLVAGAGVAHVRREQRDNFLPFRSTTTSTSPLLTLGGGVEFPVVRSVALGIDLRYQRIFGEPVFGRTDIAPDLNLTRLGGSVTYRF
jgi:opacity protein-like surface antigen